MRALPLFACLSAAAVASAAPPPYAWLPAGASRPTLLARFAPPAGAERVALPDGSFGAWLRGLPLLADGAQVHLYDGTLKARQDVHAAVIDLDVGDRDLQQCADAVMRLRAEWLYANGAPIVFHPDPGRPTELRYAGGRERKAFARWLVKLFADAGSASLQAELRPVGAGALQPGDVLIQGGYPGHAVLVLDVAATSDGKRYLLLGQSYMPAQQFHVLKNLGDPSLSPWYDAKALATGLRTPEWPPFRARDARRF
jgi:hypothetical protein